eukprot:762512-Hanusia_phi.AAC.2
MFQTRDGGGWCPEIEGVVTPISYRACWGWVLGRFDSQGVSVGGVGSGDCTEGRVEGGGESRIEHL